MTTALPMITGSDKQVAWANDIREKRITELDEMIANAIATGYGNPQGKSADEIEAQGEKYREILLSRTDAGFWINSRDYGLTTVLQLANQTPRW